MKQNFVRYLSLLLGISALVVVFVLCISGCEAEQPISSENDPSSWVSEPSSSEGQLILPEPETSSSEPEQSSSSEASSASEVSSTQTPEPVIWWREPFTCDDTAHLLRYLYLHDNSQKLSYRLPKRAFYEVLTTAVLNGKEVSKLGEAWMPDYYSELVMDSDTKYTVRFFEDGISLTWSHWKLKEKKEVMLKLRAEDYKALKKIVTDETNAANNPVTYPLWLSMMNRGRLRTLIVESGDGRKNIGYDYETTMDMMYLIEPEIRNLMVIGAGSTIGTNPVTVPSSGYSIVMGFNSGVQYDIAVIDDRLYIHSNDLDYALEYTLADPKQSAKKLDSILKRQINPNTPNYDYSFSPPNMANPDTGKPVIYLYPKKPTDCTVTVDYDSFTYTYPTYNSGWNVTAYPDGRLVNKADGSEHYYLFWEGNKQIDWRFESGFVVAGNEVESFLREKLAYMGLTPREYNDFITYWVPKMQHNRYNLITFATEQYEELAPLTVTPTPDSILRVHMVYKAIDKPVEIPEQTLSPFTRKGFTVVEWGGTVTR